MDFSQIKPINKGWSEDKKYFLKNNKDEGFLARVSDISKYESKRHEYEIMQQLSKLNIPISQPIDFGKCNNDKNVYSLLSWCDGEEADDKLPLLSFDEQYNLGIEAGKILRKIHSIKAPSTCENWSERFNRKTDKKIKGYKECGITFENDDKIINYIEDNRCYLTNVKQSLQHGDYHVGNMILSPENKLYIIDFNRFDYGDPWEEFNRIVWSAQASPYFATGQIDGYFDGEPPIEFFKLLALYISSNTLSSVYWAITFGEKEVNTMLNQAKEVLMWFDQMKNPIPIWYKSKI